MSILLVGLVLFSLSGAVAVRLQRRVEELLALSVMGIIGILYICGLAGFLPVGVYLVLALALAALVWLALALRRDPSTLRKALLTPGALVFVLALGLVWLAYRNWMFAWWDDFSHWGLVVRNMDLLDQLGNAPLASTRYRDYPPAMALFQYFWTKLAGGFTEAGVLRASGLFTYLLLLPVLQHASWKRLGRSLLAALLLLVAPLLFNGEAYTSAMVDVVMGCLCAFALYAYFSGEGKPFGLASACAALFTLSLTKTAGAGLGLIVALVIGVDMLRSRGHTPWSKALLGGALPLASVGLGYGSWKVYTILTHTPSSKAVDFFSVQGLLDVLRGHGYDYQQASIREFCARLFRQENGYRAVLQLPIYLWVALFILLGFLLVNRLQPGPSQKRMKGLLWGVGLGLVPYLLSLLVAYLFFFFPVEATQLESFARYVSTYLGLMFTFLLLLLVEDALRREDRPPTGLALALVALLGLAQCSGLYDFALGERQRYIMPLRMEASVNEASIAALDPSTDKILLVMLRENYGFDNHLRDPIIRYNLAPITNDFRLLYSLADGDKQQENPTPEQLGQELLTGGYTHLYLQRREEPFAERYASLFLGGEADIRDKGLYRVIPLEEGVRLQGVP